MKDTTTTTVAAPAMPVMRRRKAFSSDVVVLVTVVVAIVSMMVISSSVNAFDLNSKKSSCSNKATELKPPLHGDSPKQTHSKLLDRRQLIDNTMRGFLVASSSVATTAATAIPSSIARADTTTTTTTSGSSSTVVPPTSTPEEFQAYSIVPDSTTSLNPNLKTVKRSPWIKKLAGMNNNKNNKNGGAVWLGEHHNSFKDHKLQKDIIEAIHAERTNKNGRSNSGSSSNPASMAIGLEQVQVQFQPVLDRYVAGQITLDELKFHVQWEKRWFWDFNGYAPIFETAQRMNIPLIALNVNSEDFTEVQQGGLAALKPQVLRRYIKDPRGFAAFALQNEFKDYVDYVIAPSYDMHLRMGLLKTTMSGTTLQEDISYKNFLTGRLLWDESMATLAHSWVKDNPGGLLVGLVGADHVKFVDGIPGRFQRLGGAWTGRDNGQVMSSTSVILNPTLIDTRPAGSMAGVDEADSSQHPERLALQLRYVKPGVERTNVDVRRLPENTGGVLPLADYIVVS